MRSMQGQREKPAYEIIRGDTRNLPDVKAFIETLSTLEVHPALEARRLFDTQQELTIARAPGRLDVMGGIADYSGSIVLELPIAEATLVTWQKDETRRLRFVSVMENEPRAG